MRKLIILMNIQRAHQRRIWLQSSINLIYFHYVFIAIYENFIYCNKNWVKCWLISVVYSEREKETENMYFSPYYRWGADMSLATNESNWARGWKTEADSSRGLDRKTRNLLFSFNFTDSQYICCSSTKKHTWRLKLICTFSLDIHWTN